MNNAENIAASNPPFNSNDTRTRWMLKRGLHSNILNDSINISASSVLQNFMSASANAPLGKIATLEMFLSKDSLSHDSTALQNALNLCNSINPSNIVEWTHKKVLSICIHGRINDDKFSNHQVNVLRTIANMCPFTNGTAVYQARVLLVPYDPIGTDYTNSCEDGGGNARLMNPEEIVVSQVIEFRLYPNPAQNEVVLEYDLGGCKAGVVEIYDRVGKKVFEYNVTFGKDLVILPLSGLRDGIYIAVLRIDGQVVKNQKLVIIR